MPVKFTKETVRIISSDPPSDPSGCFNGKKIFKERLEVFEIRRLSLKQFFSDLEQEFILILLEPQHGTLLFPDTKGTLIIGN